jgi:hypothetical protein
LLDVAEMCEEWGSMIASLAVIGLLSVFAFALFDGPFGVGARNDPRPPRSGPPSSS